MNVWNSLSGMMEVQISTADPAALLKCLLQNDIPILDIHYDNDLCVRGKIHRKDFKHVKNLIKKRSDNLKVGRHFGLYWFIKNLILRPAVVCGAIILLISAVYLPSRVCFVEVQGNEKVPTNLILEAADACGISFGASRTLVRSEKVKNMLLSKIPDLQWAGINTEGCVAVISVREKSTTEVTETDTSVRSIVAACDGVIEQCTVMKGNALCSVGDAVKTGQVLVSGYTDCGIKIQLSRADAEIFAKTQRKFEAVCLMSSMERTQRTEEKTRYSLIIGKKQINFYKDSGISDATCVKMRETKYLTLPGGFQLPVAVVVEREIQYQTEQNIQAEFAWLDSYAEAYLRKEMMSGRILSGNSESISGEDICYFDGTYDCYEMIGVPKYEEIVK